MWPFNKSTTTLAAALPIQSILTISSRDLIQYLGVFVTSRSIMRLYVTWPPLRTTYIQIKEHLILHTRFDARFFSLKNWY